VQAAVLTIERRAPEARKVAARSTNIFQSPPILVCFGFFTLLAVATIALQAFLPSSLVAGFGVSVEFANSGLTSFLVGAALGMFAGGVIADHFGRHELVVATGLSTTATVGLAIGVLAVPISGLIPCIAVAGLAWG